MKKELFLWICMITMSWLNCVAQSQLPQYTQYLFNPYVINPSLVAAAGRGEVNVMYRQQWMGIEDSPKTIQADVQYPLSEKVALGFSVSDDRTILLSKTAILGTFGYKIPLGKEQAIGFGISTGVYSNRIRQEDVASVDQNDPVLTTASSNLKFNAQVGVHYSIRDFYIGFSALQLVENQSFNVDPQTNFKITDNMAAIASYRFLVSQDILLQPTAAYRFNADNFNYLEASLISTLYDKVQVGAGFRQHFGPLVIARVKFNQFQLGYSYDFPSQFIQVSTGGTHELQLKYSFGEEVGQYNIFRNYNKWYKGFKNRRNKYRRKTY